MAADGSVIIDVRLDKKSAIADLNALEAQIKRTTQKIGSIEKSLSSATTKRNNLRDDLEAARQKAKETAQALEEVNARLDAGHHSKYGVVSEADVALSDKLSAQYEGQGSANRRFLPQPAANGAGLDDPTSDLDSPVTAGADSGGPAGERGGYVGRR